MSVNATCAEYNANLPLWILVRDSVDGEKAIKDKGNEYLPKPSGQSDDDYSAYLKRAYYAMYTTRAIEGFYGQIFSKPPERIGETGEVFDNFLNNVDKTGTSIDQFASDLVFDAIKTGWAGILVDHSPVPVGMSQADKERQGLTSFMRWYAAENITNWVYKTINDQQTLAMVVLKEDYSAPGKDKFTPIPKVRYRVLELVESDTGAVYIQEVWEQTEDKTKDDGWAVTEHYEPELNGQKLNSIPFFTCPAKTPEKSMLLPIAYTNLAHYRITADKVNSMHNTSVATLVGVNIEPQKDAKGNNLPFTVGGTKGVFVNSNSEREPKLFYLEAMGNGVKDMDSDQQRLESSMEVMGLDTIKRKGGQETAETARIHQSGTFAVLGSFTLNMNEVISSALKLCAKWRGIPESIVDQFEYRLNTEYDKFENKELGIRLVENDIISKEKFLTQYMDMSQEEAQTEIQAVEAENKNDLLEESEGEVEVV